MASVNWESEKAILMSNYRLTDSETTYGLKLLEYARNRYGEDSLAATILLVDPKGTTLHRIKVKDGLARTDIIELPFHLRHSFALTLGAATLVGCAFFAGACYYFGATTAPSEVVSV